MHLYKNILHLMPAILLSALIKLWFAHTVHECWLHNAEHENTSHTHSHNLISTFSLSRSLLSNNWSRIIEREVLTSCCQLQHSQIIFFSLKSYQNIKDFSKIHLSICCFLTIHRLHTSEFTEIQSFINT